MNTPITILAQTGKTLSAEDGIEYDALQVTGINAELGLLVMASSRDEQGKQSSAYKAVEIMMDDMSLNLAVIDDNSWEPASAVSQCMHESLDNINEYLFSQFQQGSALSGDINGVDLSAIQIRADRVICCGQGELQCLKFSNNQLQNLTDAKTRSDLLGKDHSIKINVVEQVVEQGDVLMITTDTTLQAIGEEFIRITLSRFSDNLEMLMRQLTTRALRNGLEQGQVIILCRIERAKSLKRSWLSRLGNR